MRGNGKAPTTIATNDAPISEKEFKDFVCTRAFDIISENRYRKYLVRCREGSDQWAIEVQASINRVQSKIKAIQGKVAQLEIMPNGSLLHVCREVLGSAAPPTRIRDGYSICALTGMRVEGCIDLSRAPKTVEGGGAKKKQRTGAQGGAKESSNGFRVQDNYRRFKENIANVLPMNVLEVTAPPVHEAPTMKHSCDILIHPRFSHFFLLLWYCCKLDHVVRNFTRCWLESNTAAFKQDGEDNIQQLCERFAEQDETFTAMCKVLNHGYEHIMASIDT